MSKRVQRVRISQTSCFSTGKTQTSWGKFSSSSPRWSDACCAKKKFPASLCIKTSLSFASMFSFSRSICTTRTNVIASMWTLSLYSCLLCNISAKIFSFPLAQYPATLMRYLGRLLAISCMRCWKRAVWKISPGCICILTSFLEQCCTYMKCTKDTAT